MAETGHRSPGSMQLDKQGLARYDHFVDGQAMPPQSGQYFPSEDPYLGSPWALIARGNAADVDAAASAAERALTTGPWPTMSPSERGRLLWKFADAIVDASRRLAETERRDNGKLASEVGAQVRYMADYFKYYAGFADKIQSSAIPTD